MNFTTRKPVLCAERLLLGFMCLAVIGACAKAPERTPSRPNIVFILFDDLGYGSVGAYGSTFVKTPVLDALAAEGMRFTQFYASASICSPTRVSILMGRDPGRYGFRRALRKHIPKGLPAGTPGLDSLLKDAGYGMAQIGKWHVGQTRDEFLPPARGWDDVALLRSDGYFDIVLWDNGEESPSSGHITTVLTDHALDFLRQQAPRAAAGEPFFLNLWLRTPHKPLEPPEPIDDPVKAYAAMVENADRKIGEILAELDRLALADDTLVVVASDNGCYRLQFPPPEKIAERDRALLLANRPFRGGKRHVFEGGIRVPLIVRWPGRVEPEAVNDSVVATIDVLPTIAEILGVDVRDWQLDGESFLDALLESREQKRAGRLVWENKRGEVVFAVRRGDWKLVKRRSWRHLYDLGADPTEEHDLAEEHPELVESLTREFIDWRLDTARIRPVVGAVEGEVELDPSGDPLSAVFGPTGGSVELEKNVLIDVAHDDLTFSTWFQVPAEHIGEVPMTLARKNDSWSLDLNKNGKISLRLRRVMKDEFLSVVWPEPVEAGRWYHLVFTSYWDYSKRPKVALYLDPKGDRPRAIRRLFNMKVSATPVVLGNNNRSDRPFLGTLYDVRFYQASLCEPSVVDACLLEEIGGTPPSDGPLG